MAFRFTGFTDEAEKMLAGQIEVLEEAGWNAMEPRLVDGKSVCDLNDAEWDRAFSMLRHHGITVVGFGGQIGNWARPITSDFAIDLAELKRVAPRMRQSGTKLLRIMTYPNPEDHPWSTESWKAEVVRRLRELSAVAEDEDVILGCENCSGYAGAGPEGFLELAEAVNSRAFKLIFDTGNSSLDHDDLESSWRYYEACQSEIVHVHIKAAKPGPDGSLVPCFPDEDPMQRKILSNLVATGYDGWLSIEPHMCAVIHEGREAEDKKARSTWIEYASRLEKLVAQCCPTAAYGSDINV